MLGLLTAIPHSLVLRLATHGLALLLGMYLANTWATESALDRAARGQAEATSALIVKAKEDQKRVNDAAKQQATAYDAALFVYEQGMEDASKGRAVAERQLAAEFQRAKQLEENIDGLREVNKMLAEEFALPEPTSGCNMSVGVRRAIDSYIASINNRPASGDSEAPAASVPDGPHPSDQTLTCEQLAQGVTEILEHDAMLTAWLLSWQQWANQALK